MPIQQRPRFPGHFSAVGALCVVMSVLAACSKPSPEQMLASAKTYVAARDFNSAVIQLKGVLQAKPDAAEARFLLGKTLLDMGDPVSATVEFDKALTLKYSEDTVVPLLAKSLLQSGEVKKLTEEFASRNLTDPAAAAALKTVLATAYASLGNVQAAEAAYSAAVAAVPDFPGALVFKAKQKAGAKQFDEAIALVDRAIAIKPDEGEAWHYKGEFLLYGKADFPGATAAFRKAIELNDRYLPSRWTLINLALAQHDLKSASVETDALRKIVPSHPWVTYFDAQIAFRNKDLAKARDLVQKLLKNSSGNAEVLELAGAVELNGGSPVKAEKYLIQALQQGPNRVLSRQMLAQLYLRSGQTDKAVSVMEPALRQSDPSADTLALAAQAYLRAGDLEKAKTLFAQAAAKNPEDVKTKVALAVTQGTKDTQEQTVAELQAIASADRSGTYADLAVYSAMFSKGDFDGALKATDAIEKKQPKLPLAFDLRGRIHAQREDFTAARQSFETAVKLDPLYAPSIHGLIAIDLIEKKPEAAAKRFDAVLAADPKNLVAQLSNAGLLQRTGAPKEEVAARLTKAMETNPDAVAPRLLLIEHHLKNNDHKQALTVAQAGEGAFRNNPEFLDALGRAQLAAGEQNQAVASFNQMAVLLPGSPLPQLRLAELYVSTNNLDSATKSYQQALKIKPDLLAAQSGLVSIATLSKRPEEAIAIARTVQKQRPDSPEGFMLEAGVETTNRNFDAATGLYQKVLKRFPSSIPAVRLHSVLVAASKQREADQLADSWLKSQPKDVLFRNYLATIFMAQKDYSSALEQYRAVVALQPQDPAALNNMAWNMVQLKKPGAVELAQKANALLPNKPALMDTLASALAADKKLREAIDIQKRAVTLAPEDQVLRLNLARLYVSNGDRSEARSELDRLETTKPSSQMRANISALRKGL